MPDPSPEVFVYSHGKWVSISAVVGGGGGGGTVVDIKAGPRITVTDDGAGTFTISADVVDYADITGKPTIPTKVSELTNDLNFVDAATAKANAPVQAIVAGANGIVVTDNGSGRFVISGPPPVTSIAWDDVTGKPTFFSGDYNDLTNKPTIPDGLPAGGNPDQIIRLDAASKAQWIDAPFAPVDSPVFTGTPSVPGGSVAAPGLSFTGDQDTGITNDGSADTLVISAGGKTSLRATTHGTQIFDVTSTTTSVTVSGGAINVRAEGASNLQVKKSEVMIGSNAYPLTSGTAGQLLQTNGAGTLSWVSLGINSLSDVDTATNAPTAGQTLLWDATGAKWKPGSSSTSVGMGDLTDVDLPTSIATGSLLFYDDVAKKWSPEASLKATGTQVIIGANSFPLTTGSTGQVLKTNGGGTLAWASLGINELTDVDTTTSPTDGQSLTWSSTGSKWIPGSPSFTGQTLFAGGTFAAPGIAFTGDTDTGISNSGQADNIALVIGGSAALWATPTATTMYGPKNSGARLLINADQAAVMIKNNLKFTVGETDVVIGANHFPLAAGTNGQILKTNGSGTLSWVSLGINDLADVDTSTAAPTEGQSLLWDATGSTWKPGTPLFTGQTLFAGGTVAAPGIAFIGDTDTGITSNGFADNVEIVVGGKAAFTAQSGKATLYAPEEPGSRLVVQPTSISLFVKGQNPFQVRETLVYIGTNAYPLTRGTAGQLLQTDGAGTLSWASLGINDLADVDTSTAAPTAGQTLLWDSTGSKWKPGTPSFTGQTLFAGGTLAAPGIAFTGDTDTGVTNAGAADTLAVVVGGKLALHAGTSSTTIYAAAGSNTRAVINPNTFSVLVAGVPNLSVSKTAVHLGENAYPITKGTAGQLLQADGAGALSWVSLGMDDLTDVDTSTTAPTNGQTLLWDSTGSTWKPGTPAAAAVSMDDLTDVDTTTTAPTDGQTLLWKDPTNPGDAGQWVPGTISAGLADSPSDGKTYARKDAAWVDLASAQALQFRQGTDAERLAMLPVPASGEPIYTTDTKRLFIGDGVTVGGRGIFGDTDSCVICQPGDDLLAKYAEAKALTPGGNALGDKNRAALLIFPGKYATGSGLHIDTDYVDVIGLGSQKWSPTVFLSSTPTFGGEDVRIVGLSATNSFCASGGGKRHIINCGSTQNAFAMLGWNLTETEVCSAKFIGCSAYSTFTSGSFGQFGSIQSPVPQCFAGEIIDCRFQSTLFYGGVFLGLIKNCVGSSVHSYIAGAMQGTIEHSSFPALPWASASEPGAVNRQVVPAYGKSASINADSPHFTFLYNGHGLKSGMRIRLSGTLPAPLNASTTYYVQVVDANNFYVASTPGGTPLTGTISGPMPVTILAPPGKENGWYSYCTFKDQDHTST